MQLRPYQHALKSDIYQSWDAGCRNVCAVAPTGSGKTVLFASMIHDHQGAACAIAHRQELVGQMSLALAREEIRHRIIAPRNVIKEIVRQHTVELKRSYYDPSSTIGAAGVDTLIRRDDPWFQQVSLTVIDEAHHCLPGNKWGKALSLFPNAKGLGVTATPLRADGQGLDGCFDDLVEGPQMRELIDDGYLTDYRIFAPPGDFSVDNVAITSTGEYSGKGLRAAARQSHIVGDVVEHYVRIAPGKTGVVFATDIEMAEIIARRFRDAGINAKSISSKTPDNERNKMIRKFRNRDIQVLVNVDIFGEGFDLPALEVVSMARPTMSYGLYCQQFGRALRPMDGKDRAIIIDHAGNVMRHGLPDTHRTWSLEPRDRRQRNKHDPDLIPTRVCTHCTSLFSALAPICPYCGEMYAPADRSRPSQVDGDLNELDPAALEAMRGEVIRIDEPASHLRERMKRAHAPPAAIGGATKNHRLRQEAQAMLRAEIAQWAGWQRHAGRGDSESYKRFYFRYGIDVMSAQALGRVEAEKLTQAIRADILSISTAAS